MKRIKGVPARALARRLWRAQLRLRVMAGVVAVTLAALTAFDVTAVSVMRAYLLNQTDHDLRVALTLTKLRLPLLLPGYRPAGARAPGEANPAPRYAPAGERTPPAKSALGQFGIAYVPDKGKQVILQIGANGPSGKALQLPRPLLSAAARDRAITLARNSKIQLRLDQLPVSNGTLIAVTSLDQVDAAMGRVEEIVVFGSLAVVMLIGAGVFLVLRRGLRPVEAMAAEADRITAGDLTRRVTPRGPRSEVGRLATALNGMLARIESSVREREASQEQTSRFFADASHELRTPIASLRANAELYQQGALSDPAQVDEVMRRIALETRRMGRLVDDMLRLARLGQQPARGREAVDLTALTVDCAERAQAASPARAWKVRVASGLTMSGDPELLRRAVDNLLVNVLVHTPADAAAALTAAADDGSVVVEVTDEGPGVTPDELPHIFERFYRAGSGADGGDSGAGAAGAADSGPGDGADRRPGSGLGLAIVAEVAAAHGGTARAERRSPHGLCVTLTLPAFPGPHGTPRAGLAGHRVTSPCPPGPR